MPEDISTLDNGEVPEGRYADEFKIGYDAYKFVLDFSQHVREKENQNYFTRVIMGPDTAKDFVKIFQQSIKDYEKRFWEIQRE